MQNLHKLQTKRRRKKRRVLQIHTKPKKTRTKKMKLTIIETKDNDQLAEEINKIYDSSYVKKIDYLIRKDKLIAFVHHTPRGGN